MMKLSDQAIGAITMVLQKGLAQQGNVLDMLRDFELYEENGIVSVVNPPSFSVPNTQVLTGEEEELEDA